MSIVQICGCRESSTDIEPFVSNQKADFYGLYHSLPDGRFEWVEDFDSREDALEAAYAGIAQGCYSILDDKTFDEDQL